MKCENEVGFYGSYLVFVILLEKRAAVFHKFLLP